MRHHSQPPVSTPTQRPTGNRVQAEALGLVPLHTGSETTDAWRSLVAQPAPAARRGGEPRNHAREWRLLTWLQPSGESPCDPGDVQVWLYFRKGSLHTEFWISRGDWGWALNPVTGVPTRSNSRVKPGRDSGSVSDKPSYSKICQQRLEARREGMPSQSLRPAASTSALASRAVRRSFHFKPPVCGPLWPRL